MRVLCISDVTKVIANGNLSATRYISEIEYYCLYKTHDPGPDLDSYDLVWFCTSSNFTRESYPEIYAKAEAYEGRTVNWGCVENLTQDVMTRAWIDAGIPAPDFLSFPARHLAQFDEIPEGWDFPLMCKAAREYPLYSWATIVNNSDEYANWVRLHGEYPHILQRYYPFESPDGKFYCGQVHILGTRYVFRSYRWTNHWYVSPTPRGEPKLGLVLGTIEGMPGWDKVRNFQEQLDKIASVVNVDYGNLDFSITDDGQVIPWGICTLQVLYSEGKQSRESGLDIPHGSEQARIQAKIWNKTLEYFDINGEVTAKDIWRSILANNNEL